MEKKPQKSNNSTGTQGTDRKNPKVRGLVRINTKESIMEIQDNYVGGMEGRRMNWGARLFTEENYMLSEKSGRGRKKKKRCTVGEESGFLVFLQWKRGGNVRSGRYTMPKKETCNQRPLWKEVVSTPICW